MTIALVELKVEVRVKVMVRVSVRNAVGGTSIPMADSFPVLKFHTVCADS